MAQSPAYSKVPLHDPAVAPSAPPVDATNQQASAPTPHVYDPPPPYDAVNYRPPQGFQPAVGAPQGHPPAMAYGQPGPPGSIIQQHPTVQVVPQMPPTQVVIAQQQPAQTVIVSQTLAPGVCSVCRIGKIRDSRTCCTYFCCLFLCIFGVLPGIIAFFCCCHKPKCSHCGYTV